MKPIRKIKQMAQIKRILPILFAICILCSAPMSRPAVAQKTSTYYSETEILAVAEKIIAWKKAACGISDSQPLLDEGLVDYAGTPNADWYAIGVERLPSGEAAVKFREAISRTVLANVDSSTSSPSFKVTDIHRNILAILVAGGDPTKVAAQNGSGSLNLLSDFVYNRGLVSSLGKQGVTGWIWGLVALDSMQYDIPSGSYSSRDEMITEILKQQKSTNGFALSGDQSDPDITAMAILALSPYYNSEKVYTYTKAADQATVTKTVRQVIDEALGKLSALQLDTGDYKSWGQRNAETGAQVALALCSLGIDPQTDIRFIKNGNTLLDGILLYKTPAGGFAHSLSETSPNSVTSEQILYAMAGVIREMKGMRKLYDLRPEQAASVKSAVASLNGDIASISDKTTKSQLQEMMKAYDSIADKEKMYVYNYPELANALKKAGAAISGSNGGSFSQTASNKTSPIQSAGNSSSQNDSDSTAISQNTDFGQESLNEDSSSLSGGDTSGSSDEQKDRNRSLTTTISIIAILIILAAAGWLNIRQYRKKHPGEEK